MVIIMIKMSDFDFIHPIIFNTSGIFSSFFMTKKKTKSKSKSKSMGLKKENDDDDEI